MTSRRQNVRDRLLHLPHDEFRSFVESRLEEQGYSVERPTWYEAAAADTIAVDKSRKRHAVKVRQNDQDPLIDVDELKSSAEAAKWLSDYFDGSIYVALCGFTKQASEYAEAEGIRLIDGDELVTMIPEKQSGEDEGFF